MPRGLHQVPVENDPSAGRRFRLQAFVIGSMVMGLAGSLRVLFIGVLLQVILLTRPQGILPERPPRPAPDTEAVSQAAGRTNYRQRASS